MKIDQYEKCRSGLRVRVTEHEIKQWNIENEDPSIVKEWIKLGRERSDLNHKIDELDKKMDRFINMMGQYAHQMFMASSSLQADWEAQVFDKKDSKTIELMNKRMAQSFALRDKYFSELQISSYLEEPKESSKEGPENNA